MAKEYTEREALLKKLRYIIKTYGLSNVITEKLKKAIADSTAADVVEVRHGEWVKGRKCEHEPWRIKNPDKWHVYKCSECDYSNGRSRAANYCPNCGAKMDGERKEQG